MSDQLASLLRELKDGLTLLYRDRLKGVYLYGSWARGEQDNESDVDVLVVLGDFASYGAEVDRTAELVAVLSLRHCASISPVFVRERDWQVGDSPFLANVREEAVAA